jgi:hypothetical protein
VLSRQEQQIWDDVQRFWDEDAEEPPQAARPARWHHRRPPRDLADLPAAVVAGIWTTILLAFVGAPVAGMAVGVATALAWALWQWWPELIRQGAQQTRPDVDVERTPRGPREEPGQRRP